MKINEIINEGKTGPGLWANIHAKRKRGGKMRKPGSKGAPTDQNFKDAASEGVTEGLEYADKLSGLVDLPVFNSSTNPNPSGFAKVVNTGDRIMAVMNVRGVNVPYYISTGAGGKASVPTGKWYPVFGVHSSGWLNKGGEDSINKFYGSKMLALNANRLNNALGDLTSVESQIPFMKKTGFAIINKDLQPMGHSEVSANPDEFKKRVNSFLAKLGSEPFYKVESPVAESQLEETYDDDDEFFEAYGIMEYNDEMINESEYQGHKVTLNKPMQGDVKKFKVYVKNPKGNVVKVNFGQKGAKIKKNNPGRRKNFRARHNCDNPGPKTGARYWSCRKW